MGRKDNKVPTEKQEASHKLNFLHQVGQLVYKLCGPWPIKDVDLFLNFNDIHIVVISYFSFVGIPCSSNY